MHAASEARKERLRSARDRERKARGLGPAGAFRINGKRARVAPNNERQTSPQEGDEQYLPEDRAGSTADNEDGSYLSKEVRDLMAK
jgi:hypothetical protein